MEINELEISEITKIVEFYGEVATSPEQREEKMEAFEKKINNAFGKDHMLVAVEEGKIVGFSWSEIREAKDGKKVDRVIMLLISPDEYGIGIGGQLMEKEKKYAMLKGADVLDIEVK